jgi:ATP synthase F1 gamma subunit
MQLNELRKELQFNAELLNLIDTLKNIAGAEYHTMEKEKERFDAFLEAFPRFFRVVDLVDEDAPLVRVMSDVLGVIIVTSDSGFMGGLNQGVMRKAYEFYENLPADKVRLVVIGEKGATSIGDAGREFKFFPGIARNTIYEQAVVVKNYLVDEVVAGRMGKVMIAYPKPISFTAQTIEADSLLPCSELVERVHEVKDEETVQAGKLKVKTDKVVVESALSDMMQYLAGVWLSSRLSVIFEDSKLAEFSARALHLEGSHQTLQKDHKALKHKVFKATHEQIDKGMRESFAARGGKKKKKRKKQKLAHEAAQKAAAELAAEMASEEAA